MGSAAQHSQHTGFSKGIAGYQPLSEGALYTRLALVLAGGMAQTGADTATAAQLTRDEGQCSHCSRRALSNGRINSTLPTVPLMGLNSFKQELRPPCHSPGQAHGTGGTRAHWRPAGLGIPSTVPQGHEGSVLLLRGGNQAADTTSGTWRHREFHPVTGNVQRWALAGTRQALPSKDRV